MLSGYGLYKVLDFPADTYDPSRLAVDSHDNLFGTANFSNGIYSNGIRISGKTFS